MKIRTLICNMDGTQKIVMIDLPENWPPLKEAEAESSPQKEEAEE